MFAAAVFVRLLSFFYSQNTGGDAWAREGLTAGWLHHPSWKLIFDAWLPLHFWLMGGLTLLLGGDVRLAGRLLSLILGTASIYFLWRLADEVYGRRSALFSLAIFTFYSLHVAYSTTSSSEATYLFFVLAGLFSFFRYQNQRQLIYLVLSGLALSLAAAVRYEAWVLIFAVGLLLLRIVWRDLNLTARAASKPLLLFAITGGSWPVILMLYNWRTFGRPLYSVTMNHTWVAEQLSFVHHSLGYRLTLFPGVILLTLSPLVVLAVCYGLSKSFSEEPHVTFAILFLLFSSIQLYQIFSGGEMAFARYTLTLGTLLTVFAGLGFSRFQDKFVAGRPRLFLAGVVTLLAFNTCALLLFGETHNRFSEKFASISPRLRYTKHIQTVANYLQHHLQPTESIVVDDYNSEALILAQASGLPIPVGTRAFLVDTLRPLSDLPNFVRTEHPKYLVYSDRGSVRQLLPFPASCTSVTSWNGMTFDCVFSNEVYRIYKLTRDASTPSYSARAAIPPTHRIRIALH